jgi:hypothetical protein
MRVGHDVKKLTCRSAHLGGPADLAVTGIDSINAHNLSLLSETSANGTRNPYLANPSKPFSPRQQGRPDAVWRDGGRWRHVVVAAISDDAIFTADTRMSAVWACRYLFTQA